MATIVPHIIGKLPAVAELRHRAILGAHSPEIVASLD